MAGTHATVATSTITKPNNVKDNTSTNSELTCSTAFEDEFFCYIPQLKVLPLNDSCSCSSCSQELSSSLLSAMDSMMHQESTMLSMDCEEAMTCVSPKEQKEASEHDISASKSTDQIQRITPAPTRRHRRQRNRALGQDDFDVLILSQLML